MHSQKPNSNRILFENLCRFCCITNWFDNLCDSRWTTTHAVIDVTHLLFALQFGIWNRSFFCRKSELLISIFFTFWLWLTFCLISCLKVRVTGTFIFIGFHCVCVCVCVFVFCHNRICSLFGDASVGGSVGHLFCNVCISLILLAKLLYYFSLSLF